MRILVAEDEPIILATIKLRLKRDGHEIYTAENGDEAIREITENKPDIVITDIMMPLKSGIEVLSHAKKVDTKTKVIVLSMMGQENVVLEAFELGADDYMVKPFSPNELVARVNRLV